MSVLLSHSCLLCFAFGSVLVLVCPLLDTLLRVNVPTHEAQLFVRHFGLALLLLGGVCTRSQPFAAELAPLLLVWHTAVTAAFACEIFILRVWSSSPTARTIAIVATLLHAAVLCEGLLEAAERSAPLLTTHGGKAVSSAAASDTAAWRCLAAAAAAAAVAAVVPLRARRRRESLSGELVVITGAGGGIGRHLALEFARAGARLALWDIRAEALEAVRREAPKEARRVAGGGGGGGSRCTVSARAAAAVGAAAGRRCTRRRQTAGGPPSRSRTQGRSTAGAARSGWRTWPRA